MSSKENMPPVKDRKSKIPVPNMMSVRKGMKRAVSPNACKSDPKRSPSTTKRSSEAKKGRQETRNGRNLPRKTLGELPCEQRKIVKVRRTLNDGSNKAKAVKKQAMENVTGSKKDIGRSNGTTGFFDMEDIGSLPDQSGIEFETDDSALQSILDETGIQYAPPKHENQPQMSKFSRHTLAAVPKPRTDSVGVGPSRVKVEDFRKVCDEFISRNTSKQPNAKRQRTGNEFRSEDKFTLKLTPSKTDFSTRFGAEKHVTFQGVTPGLASRQSLPGRTSVRNPDPFIIPGRSSMIGQARRRLAKVGEEEVLGATPSRASLAPQTPQRVLKKSKNEEDASWLENEVFSENRHQTPGRVSLSTQKPGRVSLSAQTLGRPSLSAQTPGRQSLSTQTPGRASLAPQTPSRVSLYDKTGNMQHTGRPSLITQPPGRVSLSAQRQPAHGQNKYPFIASEGRLSLAAQTPGRVSLLANQKPHPQRVSMIDHTPGRVKIENKCKEEETVSKKADDLCENLVKKFLMETPEKEAEGANYQENKIDTVSKTLRSKTPTKEKAATMCATPLRVKLLHTEQSTPKSTPQRVLKSATIIQHTPQRVQVQGTAKSPFSTPQEPMRVPKKMSTPATPIRVPVVSPCVLPRQPADVKQETPSRKTPMKSKLADGVDLRTIWKTKKTPSKSPILKEVLVKKEESSSEVSTPKNDSEVLPGAAGLSIKKKKTLTWADALETCQTTATDTSEIKDVPCATLQVKSKAFHDAMQDSPHQEKSTSSPEKNSHVTTLTNSLHSLDNMQLPVCLTGSSSKHSASSSGNIDNENQPDLTDSCSNADHSLVSHPSTSFAQSKTDSLLVSQCEIGQHESNLLANKTQDEFLQKQIELFNEKKRQLAKLQMQIQEQLYKSSNVGPATLDQDLSGVGLGQKNAVEQTANINENKQNDGGDLKERVDNQHFSRNLNVCNQDFSHKSDTLTQGINVSRQVNLDLNSNVTSSDTTLVENLHNVNVKENPSVSSLHHPSDPFSGTQYETQNFCTPKKQKARFDDQEDITPYILKPDIDFKKVTETGDARSELDFKKDDSNDVVEETEKVNVPLWTPLAMKTVARQQTVGTVAQNIEIIDNENVKAESELESDIIAKSEIDTSVVNSECTVGRVNGLVPNPSCSESSTETGVYSEKCLPKTPPNKKSAFRSITSSSGLTPVVGSLSLRGNIEDKFETQKMHQSDSLHKSVLRAANERYLEALLDDEVALFMCRLSHGNVLKKGRDLCHDPVARILLGGDDMHFIPIEMDSNDLSSAHIEGSAFTKYATRAT